MYEIGNQVLYGIHGICTVTAIERMRFGKEMRHIIDWNRWTSPGRGSMSPWRMQLPSPSCAGF